MPRPRGHRVATPVLLTALIALGVTGVASGHSARATNGTGGDPFASRAHDFDVSRLQQKIA
jgi:hypothetical protein